MYRFLCKMLVPARTRFAELARSEVPLGSRTLSSSLVEDQQSKERNLRAVAVSYLMDSCGLPSETARSVSKKLGFLNPEKADSVLAVLRNHGFNDTHIAKLVKKYPRLLLLKAEKTILPKLEFFSSIGVTSVDLANTLSSYPTLLASSLKKRLVPNFEFLKGESGTNENVIKALMANHRIFLVDVQKSVAPNLAALREAGVPQSLLRLNVTHYASVVMQSPKKFDKCFNQVIELGPHPRQPGFVKAMHVFSTISEPSRAQKMDVLVSSGWSKDEFWSAFRRCPLLMSLSEKLIARKMDFLVKDMCWSPSAIARCPSVLLLSLETRLMPRCSVIKLLQSKGFLKKNLCLSTFLLPSEKIFYGWFVASYLNAHPHQLLGVYQKNKDILPL